MLDRFNALVDRLGVRVKVAARLVALVPGRLHRHSTIIVHILTRRAAGSDESRLTDSVLHWRLIE